MAQALDFDSCVSLGVLDNVIGLEEIYNHAQDGISLYTPILPVFEVDGPCVGSTHECRLLGISNLDMTKSGRFITIFSMPSILVKS